MILQPLMNLLAGIGYDISRETLRAAYPCGTDNSRRALDYEGGTIVQCTEIGV